jgi:hypothetical protein
MHREVCLGIITVGGRRAVLLAPPGSVSKLLGGSQHMAKLDLVFLKRSESLFAKLISWWTESEYSHVELRFSDGLTYSADFQLGVIKFITRYDPLKWDIFTIELPDEEVRLIRDTLDAECGLPYDWFGILLAQVFKSGRDNPAAWFCSELATYAFQSASYFTYLKPCDISPGGFYTLCKDQLMFR